jgi:hypothetical protein
VYKGIDLAKDMLFLNLMAESDSSNVINVLKETQPQNFYLGTIAQDCKKIFSSFNTLEFSHVRHVANQAAHYLAKFSISS